MEKNTQEERSLEEKVLIADDNEDVKSAMERALSFELGGREIDFASNADEAIEKARQNNYSLIITDNNMEDGYGNSGLYAIEQIRSFNKDVPIILYTGQLTSEIASEALEKGANRTVNKRDIGELRNAIRDYLAH